MIEAVFLIVAYMNGSQTITPVADMLTCEGLRRAVRQSYGTGHDVKGATRVQPIDARCITIRDGQVVPISGAKSAAPAKE